jgi:hypothetical protein
MIMWMVAFCLWTASSQAALLDLWAFTSLGTLNTSDAISINTDTLQLSGGASYTGVLDPVSGATIFAFDNSTGTSLSIYGTRTLGLLSTGNIAFTGTIDLFGGGGLDMVALGTATLANVQPAGSGGTVSLTANQINGGGSVNAGSRPLEISAVQDLNLSSTSNMGSVTTRISGRDGLVLMTGTGFARGTVELGSGQITLTGRTPSGQLMISPLGEIVSSPGVTLVAPVPIPAAFLLFTTGLGLLSLVLKRRLPE